MAPGPNAGVSRAVGVLGRAPATLGLIGLLWILGAATGSLVDGPAPGLRSAVGVGVHSLGAGHWWTLLSSGLWCSGLVSYIGTTILLLTLVAPAEVRIGSVRTAASLGVAQVLGAAAGIGVVALGGLVDDVWTQRLASDLTVGPSGAAVAIALGVTGRLGALQRRRLRLGLIVALGMAALYSGSLQDVLRLVAGLLGLAAGVTQARLGQRSRSGVFAVSGPETRVLLALIVAASALGPLLAALSSTAIGPLSVLRFLVLTPPPDAAVVHAVCLDPTMAGDCTELQFRLRLGGPGPAVMTLLPVMLLLVLADGLRRGRRFAWWGALALNLLFAGLGTWLGVLTVGVPAERLITFGTAGRDSEFYAGLVAAVAQPLVVAALLVAHRRRFTLTAPARAYRGWVATVTGTLLFTATVYLVGGYLLRAQFSPQPDWADLLADLPTRFLPPGYLGEVDIAFLPTAPAATVLYEATGVVFWAVTLGVSLRVLRRNRIISGDAGAARALLERHGGSSMSYLTTWAGHRYWFDPAGNAAVAYRVIGGVALTTGEPFGAPAARLPSLAGFARFCTEHAWTPCLYGVGEPARAHATGLGWASVQVAEETVLALSTLEFTGRKWQDVRSARNNASKVGITAEWIAFGSAPRVLTEQIRAISEHWVADNRLPEMGFTLGGLDELDDPDVRCLIALDANRTVHGVTSWLPCYDAGRVVGWTLDFMRRRDGGFRPVMEFLIATAALRLKEEGASFVSLSGAPLARIDRGEPVAVLQRVLDRLGHVLEPVYGFGSLLAFKAKFQPEYRPMYLVYPDPAALPAIAAAITRAYLPDLTISDTVGALQLLRRHRRDRAGPERPAARVAQGPKP